MASHLGRLATAGVRGAARVGRAADTLHSAAGKAEKLIERGERAARAVEFAASQYKPRAGLFPRGALASGLRGEGGEGVGMPIYLPGPAGLEFPAYCDCEPGPIEDSTNGLGIYKCHACHQRQHLVFKDGEGDGTGAGAAAAASRGRTRSKKRAALVSSIVAGVKLRTNRRPARVASPGGAGAGARSRSYSRAASPGGAAAAAAAGPGGKKKGKSKKRTNDPAWKPGNNGNTNNSSAGGGGLRRFTQKLRKSK